MKFTSEKSSFIIRSALSYKTHFTLCLGKLGAILIKLPGQAPHSGATKLVAFHIYRGQVGKGTIQSRRTFTTRLEVIPESTSYLQELSVQASSCPVTPSSLSPSPNRTRKWSQAGGRKPSPWRCLQEGCQPVTQATALTTARRPRRPLAGRAPEGRREGKELGPVEKSANHSPHLREAGSRGVQGAERQLPGHTLPGARWRHGEHPSTAQGRSGRAAGQRSLLARPDKEAPNPAREEGKRGARGDKTEPPAPTAPPDRLHLSPTTMEGRKRRGGGCSPHGKSAASSGCGSSRGTTTAACSPALLSRPPGRGRPALRAVARQWRRRLPRLTASLTNQSGRGAAAEKAVEPLATPVRPARPRLAQPSRAPRPLGRGAARLRVFGGAEGSSPPAAGSSGVLSLRSPRIEPAEPL